MFTSLLFVVALPSTASALDQGVHRSISREACEAVGLPSDFCARVGTEVYNVDKYEWNDLSAHAQMDGDVGDAAAACTGANKALERVRLLGADMRDSLAELRTAPSEELATHIATQLGRALHTIQDNCAHNGMVNPQHGWASVTDTCTGSKTSPDAQPEAAACARRETAIVMASFADAVAAAGVSDRDLDGIATGWAHWPARGDVCEFLHGAATWHGRDTRWNNNVVVPFLQDQLSNALTVDDTSVGDVCEGGPTALARSDRKPNVKTTKAPWCFQLSVYCLGAADAADAPPPWVDPAEDAASAEPVEPVEPAAGGCSTTPASSSSGFLLGASVLGLALSRRRRR